MDIEQVIAQAEAQERALLDGLIDIRGYLRALREVRDAIVAARQPAEEPAAPPIDELPLVGDDEGES